MDLRKIYTLMLALPKSQLRTSTSGRSGASFFRKPSIILILDVVAFSVCAVLGYLGVVALRQLFPFGADSPGGQSYSSLVNLVKEALIFIPTFVPSSVVLGGILFELNVSSK